MTPASIATYVAARFHRSSAAAMRVKVPTFGASRKPPKTSTRPKRRWQVALPIPLETTRPPNRRWLENGTRSPAANRPPGVTADVLRQEMARGGRNTRVTTADGSKLPLLPSGPGAVRKSAFHGPWRGEFVGHDPPRQAGIPIRRRIEGDSLKAGRTSTRS